METEVNDTAGTQPRYHVMLFVTCLADLFRPSVAFDTISLLERCECEVFVPPNQTCCGQPAYNSGDYDAAIPMAKQLIEAFEQADYVVVPSGSCASMISCHYPKLLQGEWQQRAIDLAAKTYELTNFLAGVVGAPLALPSQSGRMSVTYHDSCSGLRDLDVSDAPRELLHSVCDTTVTELENSNECCGFGGTFCTKLPQLSDNMADNKLDSAMATGCQILSGGDLGCLLHLAGRASRTGKEIEIRHIVELLADNLSHPAIGEGSSK